MKTIILLVRMWRLYNKYNFALFQQIFRKMALIKSRSYDNRALVQKFAMYKAPRALKSQLSSFTRASSFTYRIYHFAQCSAGETTTLRLTAPRRSSKRLVNETSQFSRDYTRH